MDLETVLSDSKWEILAHLSHGPNSPTELSQKTGTSAANISSQMKLLEALDFIEKERLHTSARGEPRKKFSLKKQFVHITIAAKSIAGKKLIRLDEATIPFFSVWLAADQTVSLVISKFLLDNEQLSKEFESIGLVSQKGDEIELLALHNNPGSFKKEHVVLRQGRELKINLIVHTREDFEAGIHAKSEYFVALIKKAFILKDTSRIFSKAKREAK